jgi:hypothetical protein
MKNEKGPREWLATGPVEEQIDRLIEAGWYVLESDFDRAAFINWRQRAFQCLLTLLGPDHPYTEYFKAFVVEAEKFHLLAGAGILAAAKEKAQLNLREMNTPMAESDYPNCRRVANPDHTKMPPS